MNWNWAQLVGYLTVSAAAIVAISTIVKVGNRGMDYFYHKRRANEITRQFTYDMANNHLPHIYESQKQIATALGIELKEPPPIRWEQQAAEARTRQKKYGWSGE